MLNRFILILTTLWLGGCATSSNLGADHVLDPAGTKGLLVASITHAGQLSAYNVYYRQVPDGVEGRLRSGQGMVLIPLPDAGDFQDRSGHLVTAELPAGEYEVHGWGIDSGYAHVRSTGQVSIRFLVEPGRAVYLGNFDFTPTSKLGATITGAEVVYREAMDRDLAAFRKKHPRLAATPVTALLEKGASHARLGSAGSTRFNMPLLSPVKPR